MTIELKYFGHSAFQIKVGESTILIDPFLTQNPMFKENIKDIVPTDILLTHGHSDHLGDAIELSKASGATITAVFELADYCESRGAIVNPVNLGSKLHFNWGGATFLPATHSSSTPDGKYAGIAASILLKFNDKRIFHAGDTGLHSDLKLIGEYYRPDISILPIGGHFTLGINEAVQAAKWLGSKTVIPMHYNTFPAITVDASEFKNMIETDLTKKCIVMKPSEIVSFSSSD